MSERLEIQKHFTRISKNCIGLFAPGQGFGLVGQGFSPAMAGRGAGIKACPTKNVWRVSDILFSLILFPVAKRSDAQISFLNIVIV